MVSSSENFDLENNPVSNNSWENIANGDHFLGNWKVTGGDEEIELSHELASDNFKDMALSFDYTLELVMILVVSRFI